MVWNHEFVRPARKVLTSRRHIDLLRVAGAAC
ncbi:putative leader peptide [Jatrophihabitans sp. DSM 45814]